MKIYNDLLKGIADEVGMSNKKYLPTLKPKVVLLRNAYRNAIVNVDYSNRELQSAYLLTYTPHYYQIIYSVFLEHLSNLGEEHETINLGFIGGGPGSEVYGVVKYLLENNINIRIMNIYILDKYADTWVYSQNIVKENLIELCNTNQVNINFESIAFDLVGVRPVSDHMSIFNSLHFLSIQNCLNEISSHYYPQLLENISELQGALSNEAVFAIVDLTSSARRIMTQIYKHLKGKLSYALDISTLNANTAKKIISLHYKIPQILKEGLLDGSNNLIPRKNLTYDYVILSPRNGGVVDNTRVYGFKDLYKPLLSKTLCKNPNIKNKVFVGIDFGTSTSTATMVFIDSKNEIVSVAVDFEQKDKNNEILRAPVVDSVISLVGRKLLVGKYAANEKINLSYGINSWFNLKDCLSGFETFVYPKSKLATNSKYKIANAKEAIVFFIKYMKSQIDKKIEEFGFSVDGVEFIASIPVTFDKKSKDNLKDCFSQAHINLDDYQFIEEPVGAVINYLYENDVTFDGNKKIMILDLGAGTFDVSIIGLHNDLNLSSKLLSTFRDGTQGGNFLNKLMLDDLKLTLSDQEIERYLNEIEKIKIECCKGVMIDRVNNFKLGGNAFSEDIIHPNNSLNISISAKNLSYIFDNYFSILRTTISTALERANVMKIDTVLITGGGGKNPYFQKYIYNEFSDSEIFIADNSQEQVSRGSAIHSLLLNGFGNQLITPVLNHDIFLKGKKGPILLFSAGILLPSEEIIVEISNLHVVNNKVIFTSSYYDKGYLEIVLVDQLNNEESIQFSIDQNYFIDLNYL